MKTNEPMNCMRTFSPANVTGRRPPQTARAARSSSARRLARSLASGSFTRTSSKKVSTALRSARDGRAMRCTRAARRVVETASASARIASKRRTSAGATSTLRRRARAARVCLAQDICDAFVGGSEARGLGQPRNAASACRRASKSSGERGRVASTASNISVEIAEWPPPGRRPPGTGRAGAPKCSRTRHWRCPAPSTAAAPPRARLRRRRSSSSRCSSSDAQHADGCAPQSERVAGTAGLLTDRKNAGQRVELVGQRQRHARI